MKKKSVRPETRGFDPDRRVSNKEKQQDSQGFQVTEQAGTEKLVEERLRKFGVEKRSQFSKKTYEELGPYDRLVSRFGAKTLLSFEKGLLWTCSFLVVLLVFSGIVLSVDAFLHSSLEKETSNNFIMSSTVFVDEATTKVVQPFFTPLILLFFFTSITLGILKSLQLTSSKTVYRE
ncbi:hypothetical protein GAYE_PCTG10G0400 [Galdieria yellowstonensis]|uniref:Uncharacterized protein n=1 Tax=Galdieria yellowstonensis TaxID=3028027 RepID=A0AAV9I6F7_9RHOD|nr:hypothetical protein GAYE_PCTG10G0400 [Galdieria yellowstonensis]